METNTIHTGTIASPTDAELTYTIHVPVADKSILLSIAKRMGWVAKRKKSQKTCRLDEAIRASREDTLFETHDLYTLMKSLKS